MWDELLKILKLLISAISANRIIAFGTILLAIIAVFQDKLRQWVMKPKLDISVEKKPPDCIMTLGYSSLIEEEFYILYIRVRVTNTGNAPAKNVEVFIKELKKLDKTSDYIYDNSFLPMNLEWSYTKRVYCPLISPKMYKHCDLAHIIDPSKREFIQGEDRKWRSIPTEWPILSFNTIVKPASLNHLLPVGKYQILLIAAAENCKPVSKSFVIALKAGWWNNESTELLEGLDIYEV